MTKSGEKRRLAAILVADVAGYSRLMEADEGGTLAALKQRRKTILEPVTRDHGGRVVKLMGDGALIEFASIVNAVQAALELQRKMGEANEPLPKRSHVVLRIGVNLGDVISEGSDIYGDGVNVAARLEALAPPGGICVSDKVRNEILGKIDFEAEDMGEVALKNLGRKVRVYRIGTHSAQSEIRRTSSHGMEERTSIAVLPFVNMSGDPEQDFFADGLAEDLITELSRNRHLSVTARNTTFTYKGRAVNVPEVARQLGVDFVVEGSVRRAGSRVRITVQLIDSISGAHAWAEKFDKNIEDIFAVQDEVIDLIVARFAFGLDEAAGAQRRRNPTTSGTAYTYFLEARAIWRNGEEQRARELLLRAIELDPNYARALGYLSYFYSYGRFSLATGLSDEESVQKARDYAQKALALDRSDPFTLHRAAMTYTFLGETPYARSLIEAAANHNPRDLDLMVVHGLILAYCGEHQAGLRLLERVASLEPRMPPGYLWALSDVCYLVGDFQRAHAAVEGMIDPPPFARMCQAACLAQLGRSKEAQLIIERVSGQGSLNRLVSLHIAMLVLPKDQQLWLDGFRKAGIAI